MKNALLLAALCLLLPASAAAYDGITFYGANLSAKDRVNSKGVPLKSVRDFLQQDRANYYKFDRRDPEDQQDGYFDTVATRNQFKKVRIRIDPQLERRILDGTVRLVSVWVYTMTELEVTEGLPATGAD
jgi:hypothetical protein